MQRRIYSKSPFNQEFISDIRIIERYGFEKYRINWKIDIFVSKLLNIRIRKINNIISHLTHADICGYIKEMHGTKIRIKNGKNYDHVSEVRNAISGLKRQKRILIEEILNGKYKNDIRLAYDLTDYIEWIESEFATIQYMVYESIKKAG